MSDPADIATAGSVVRVPDRRLRRLVTSYYGYHYRVPAAGVHHGIPTTSLTVVIALDQPIDVGWLADPQTRSLHWALASGMSTEPAGIYHSGAQHGIQLDLTPAGARVLLGVPAAALRREIVPLDGLLGSRGGRLYDVVAGATCWRARFAALERELLTIAGEHDDEWGDPTLERAWRRVHEESGAVPVARLADEVGWSRRQLSSRFTAEFGIGPKQAARLVRFSAARDLVVSRRLSLAAVAARCGYADQAHLTREWRDLAGVPPTRWIEEERMFLGDAETPRPFLQDPDRGR